MGGCHDHDAKVTIMVLHVDLGCCRCYKKVKNILCKFPQIRDQRYDEKQNTVTIRVVCCSPEKIRDKLCCKGGKSIKRIEILEPPKPKPQPPPSQPKPKPKPESPPPPPPRPKPKPDPPPPPPPQPPCQKPPEPQRVPKCPPRPQCCGPCYEGIPGGPCYQGYGPGPPCPPSRMQPVATCCGPCSEGIPGGPCYQGYGPGSGPGPSYCYSDGYEPRYCRCDPRYCRCECYHDQNQAPCSIL